MQTQQRFESETHNVFNEEINKIILSSKMIKECNQLIRQKHMHIETRKYFVSEKEEIKYNYIIKRCEYD